MITSTDNVNNSFFNSVYKDVWKKLIPNGLTEAEVDFIMEIAGLQQGDRVLDIMCGYGRHSIELAKREVSVTSIDNLNDYIEEIKAKALEQNLPVRAFQAGVLEVELDDNYDAIICMGNSFSFFNKEETSQILRKLANSLKSEGILIINSWMIAEIALKHFKEKDWHQVGEYKYLLDYKFHFLPNRIESEQTIVSTDGTVDVLKGIDYIFSLDELESMFRAAGLRTKELFSTPRKRNFVLGDGRVYIVVEKAM
ncbi:MAG TPA: methyltransferase domain-containing protein [Flavisolibacter sp.]|nr:methyltransferase domain-containing protein [Flavisolibacter sp.]